MSKLYLQGCGTALVTPFRGGAVDYDAYTSCIVRQVEAGVDFLVPLATTGETPTLSTEERLRLLDITRKYSGGLPLLVGCGTNSLQGTLDNIRLTGFIRCSETVSWSRTLYLSRPPWRNLA